nr:hypothetical protein CFP56_04313 [Quercus suber]
MVPEHISYSGATIFWLYNGFALLFAGIVIYTIYQLPGSSRRSNSPHHATAFRLFSGLSMISFAILSTNMLNVLIQSFSQYRTNHADFVIRFDGLPQHLYHWSLTTPLFHDFGEAILANSARCLWTQGALFATLWVCLFMASKGQQLRMPRLWAFFALSQILPISFAQNLFYLALMRLPQHKPDLLSKHNDVQQYPMIAEYQICAVAVAYFATLLYAPETIGTTKLMPTILLARSLLLSPLAIVYWSIRPGNNLAFIQGARFVRLLVIGLAILIMVQGRETFAQFSIPDMVSELTSHPAVSALGMDALLCTFSCLAWTYCGQLALNSQEAVST